MDSGQPGTPGILRIPVKREHITGDASAAVRTRNSVAGRVRAIPWNTIISLHVVNINAFY